MRTIRLILLFTIIVLLSNSNVRGNAEYLYGEETSGYYNLDGEILRFDGEREFAIQSYEFVERDINGSTKNFVEINMLDDSTVGIPETVLQPLHFANFEPALSFLDNGSLHKVEWDVYFFRLAQPTGLNPFSDNGLFVDRSKDHRTFDRVVNTLEFSSSLEYFEYTDIDGELTKLKVNTELTTDNAEDGRVIRTALHIVKRDPSGTILFTYSYQITEANQMARAINLLDRPNSQLVPFQLGIVLLLVYLYIRATRYWKKNDLRIVKGEHNGKEEKNTSE